MFLSSGEWKNGLKHGKGVEATKEGRYEGEWRDDMVIVNKNNKHYYVKAVKSINYNRGDLIVYSYGIFA